MDSHTQLRAAATLGMLVTLWWLEAWAPFWNKGTDPKSRRRHAARNLGITALHVAMMALLFASATSLTARWAESAEFGVLHWAPDMPAWMSTVIAVILMDGWMYAWHRMNHVVPFFWRFHRVHHSDPHMDVTTATRFHPAEIAVSAVLRLGVIAILGMSMRQVVIYGLLHLPVIQFHHSNVRLPERVDRAFRALLVSPTMHRVHHSRYQPETDSNYSSILSVRTFASRQDEGVCTL